jgi:hypothetical protein
MYGVSYDVHPEYIGDINSTFCMSILSLTSLAEAVCREIPAKREAELEEEEWTYLRRERWSQYMYHGLNSTLSSRTRT